MPLELIMTKGLPGSGKSTWAKARQEAFPFKYKRINKDSLREMLDGGKWSREAEKFTLVVRDMIIRESLAAKTSVIVDDTNFAPVHEETLRRMAQDYRATFLIQDFTDIPLKTCIENDLKRPNSVGEAVIRKMAKQYLGGVASQLPHAAIAQQDPSLPGAIICDIDGTVALMNGRGPYESHKYLTDVPNPHVADFVRAERAAGNKVIYLSGRDAGGRRDTFQWLLEHNLADATTLLHMRPAGDKRKDAVVKKELYEAHIKPYYYIRFVLDDRQQVVDMWRELGLTCFQVAPGDF